MCTSPLRIINNSRHYTPDGMPLYFDVPCGHCQECEDKLRNDWFVRCYYEWFQHSSKRSTFFYTLTYNDDNLPTYSDCPCFSKRHIQLFIKRLRNKIGGRKLRYMVSSEFGTLRGRPHYHALFFLDDFMPPYQFYKAVEDSWQYGFVKYGDNMGVVTNSAGIKYVTKYVVKDFSHTDEFLSKFNYYVFKKYKNVIDFFNRRRGFILSTHFDGLYKYKLVRFDDDYCEEVGNYIITRIRREINSRLPFHLQSTRLGLSILDLQCDFQREVIPMLSKGQNVINYPLPRYIKRKLWFDAVENELDGKKNKFVLNEAGKHHYLESLPNKVESEKRRLVDIFNSRSLITEETNSFVFKFTDATFQNGGSLGYWLKNFDLDFDIMAIYSTVFRGRVQPFVCDLSDKLVKDSYIDYADFCLNALSDVDFGHLFDNQFYKTLERYTWDKHPYFAIYEFALQIFDAIDLHYRLSTSIIKIETDKKVRATREYFNKHY